MKWTPIRTALFPLTVEDIDLVAGLVEDMEAEDDAAGYEDEPEARVWGWAA